MRDPSDRYSTNLLLQALSHDDLALLEPHFVRETLHRDSVLVTAERPIEHVWFLEGGVASIVANMDFGATEVGIFGLEGFSGTPLLLGAESSPHQCFIQVNGHTGLRIAAAHVLEGTGMIRSKRGRVTILDREKLEDLAGENYGPAEAEYRRLIGPFGKTGPGLAAD